MIQIKRKLSPWELDAKKWREENGYTTLEWVMYAKNRQTIHCLISFGYGMLCLFVGILVGICW